MARGEQVIIYNRRKKGQVLETFFQDVKDIKTMLQDQAAADAIRWAELFRQVHGIDEDELTLDDQEPWTKI